MATNIPLIELPEKYGTIISDYPWPEKGGGKIKRGADKHYPVMTVAEGMAMGPAVQSIATPDSHLYFWVTNNYLPDGLKMIEAWGFKYITCLTWEKYTNPGAQGGNIGLGQYFRGTTEHCLFAKRGQPKYKLSPEGKRQQGITGYPQMTDEQLTTLIEEEGAWFFEKKTPKHSEKPHIIHHWAEKVSHGPYLEMFARTLTPGWTSWGNEIQEVKP